jgi:hypothetical protein
VRGSSHRLLHPRPARDQGRARRVPEIPVSHDPSLFPQKFPRNLAHIRSRARRAPHFSCACGVRSGDTFAGKAQLPGGRLSRPPEPHVIDRRGHRSRQTAAGADVCLSLLFVPHTALGQSSAAGQGESEEDLRGPWLVTVHLTINNNGMSVFPQAETGDYKATTTFVPTTTDHYTASGQVNAAPKTDEERIYNVYFESCARGEGRDIAKTSSQTYKCSYEYSRRISIRTVLRQLLSTKAI